MKQLLKILILTMSLGAAVSASAVETKFRRLTCSTKATLNGKFVDQQSREVWIPEDAFNYTLGMQTFWVPVNMTIYNPTQSTAFELFYSVAMEKVGENEGIANVFVKVRDVVSKFSEILVNEEHPIQKDSWVKYYLPYTNLRLSMNCVLEKKSYPPR